MRYAAEHKAESRERIVRSAARDIRRLGPDRVGVADVMAAAGLTHGGFYAHFASKEALVADAVDAMFADAQRRPGGLEDALADAGADIRTALRAHLAAYLSPAHRDGRDRGCPLPALAADMARTDGAARRSFVRGLKQMTARIEAALVRMDRDNAGAEASAVVAQMVGAVGLAGVVGQGEESDAILRNSLDALVSRLGL